MSNEQKLPDWKDAPEWANWRAVDQNGELCYYLNKPVMVGECWDIEDYGQPFERVGKFNPIDWRESLEYRPEPQKLNYLKSADMENDPDSVYTIFATFKPEPDNEPPQINQPVNDEWFVFMGFQFHKKSETFIIPAMRGGYNYDIEVNAQFIALRDIEKESVTVLHDTMHHGAITQEKVLHTLMLFN